MQQDELTELQNLVEKLDGVLSAKLTADENGGLCEIHVLADKSKSPKQLSRDIQSAIAARTGTEIEHRIVSIAQIDQGIVTGPERLKIAALETSNARGMFSVIVKLCDKEENEFRGTASEINTLASRRKAIANATLSAIHDYLKLTPFSLSDIQKFRIAGMEEVNVATHYFRDGYDRLLTGTALVTDDEYGTVIKATLDAVNRVIPIALD